MGLSDTDMDALLNLMDAGCGGGGGGGGGGDSSTTRMVLGTYEWTHSCTDTCSCAAVMQVGDFCVAGDVVCMKVSSTLVGTIS